MHVLHQTELRALTALNCRPLGITIVRGKGVRGDRSPLPPTDTPGYVRLRMAVPVRRYVLVARPKRDCFADCSRSSSLRPPCEERCYIFLPIRAYPPIRADPFPMYRRQPAAVGHYTPNSHTTLNASGSGSRGDENSFATVLMSPGSSRFQHCRHPCSSL